MIKAIVFDCFGVLVGQGYQNTYRRAGGDPIKDKKFIDEMMQKANLGLISADHFSSSVASRLNLTLQEYREIIKNAEQINQPIFDLIVSNLKASYKIGLLSNANKGVVERKIPKDLLQLFDIIVISGEVGFVKPDPKIFKLSADELGIELEEMVFIDDLSVYVNSAKELGINTIHYTGFDNFKQELKKILSKDF